MKRYEITELNNTNNYISVFTLQADFGARGGPVYWGIVLQAEKSWVYFPLG
jgi:hypothetical protein